MTAIALLRGCQLCNCPVENHGVTRYEYGNQLDYGTPQILHLENLEESKAYIKCDQLLMDRCTTVNDLPNQFALVRLGKKVMWEVSHKYTSYQTLVKRPIE